VNDDHGEYGLTPAAVESLKLPAAFDAATHATALDLDGAIAERGTSADALNAKVSAHREATFSNLLTFRGKQSLDVNLFRWPASLYIPQAANPRDYYPFGIPPDDHRYALEWVAPPSATANRASRQDGALFSFSELDNQHAGSAQSSESGVGIFSIR
jgi:hypothetical protein